MGLDEAESQFAGVSAGTASSHDIAVSIPYFRNKEQLEQCIEHLQRQTVAHRLRIYIRDNSTDNILFTKAVNEGLLYGMRFGDTKYHLLLNQDCYLMPDAIEKLVYAMEHHPEMGVCGPVQHAASQPEAIMWAGSLEAFPFGRHNVAAPSASEKNQGGIRDTPWVNGAAMLIRDETLRECGLLDKNMEFICSDADFSFTARARGWQCSVVINAQCLHELGASTAQGTNPELEKRKLLDVKFFCEKWLNGHLYRRLALEGPILSQQRVDAIYQEIATALQ